MSKEYDLARQDVRALMRKRGRTGEPEGNPDELLDAFERAIVKEVRSKATRLGFIDGVLYFAAAFGEELIDRDMINTRPPT